VAPSHRRVNWRDIGFKLETPADCRCGRHALPLPHVGGTKLRGDRAVNRRSSFDVGMRGGRSRRTTAGEDSILAIPGAASAGPDATLDAAAAR